VKKVVSMTSGLAVLAVLALASVAVGTSMAVGANAADPSSSLASGHEKRCDVSDLIHAALGHREPGQTMGSVISEIARQMCRPQIRH